MTSTREFVHRFWPYAMALLIVGLVEAVFLHLLMTGSVHSPRGGAGMMFFLPAMLVVWALFPNAGSDFVFGIYIFIVQMFFLVPPVLWLLTWKKRSKARTILQILAVAMVVLVSATICARILNSQQQRRDATMKASRAAVVATLRTLNAALADYRKLYGGYPARLEQLGPAPAGTRANSDRANLVTFPLQGELYFVLSYEVVPVESTQRAGYEVHADPKSPEHSFLYHYFTDQTGLIRSNNVRATATSLVIMEDTHPTVTIE